MDLRQVRYFLTVAEKGSISAAAAVLHVAQSAISRQMRLLEEDLGGPLFHRSIAGVQLTDSGAGAFGSPKLTAAWSNLATTWRTRETSPWGVRLVICSANAGAASAAAPKANQRDRALIELFTTISS